jgi:hypothetical protein
MDGYAELELSLHRTDSDAYRVDFRFSQPDTDADISLQALANISLPALTSLNPLPAEYGQALTASLFMDEKLRTAFAQARTSAQSLDRHLRLRLMIGSSAPELHNLRWELLCDPGDKSALATDENMLFSRYLASQDWRPVRLKPKDNLRALLMFSNPADLINYKLAAVDVQAELERARIGLGEIPFNLLPTKNGRTTLDNLSQDLRGAPKPVEILYMVCHGALVNGQPILLLEDASGNTDKVAGSEFVTRLKELQDRPRLVVLISCQSASQGSGDALSALGPRLAEIGIPAILAMQANISMETAASFLPVFFQELQRDGQIDRALSVARGAIRTRPDYWVPVLFMRLKSGRLWYTPGFGGPRGEFEKWPALLRGIQSGRCTPILGPGLTETLMGSLRDLAQRWADDLHYPLAPYERDSLPQVAQYRAVDQSRFTAEDEWLLHMRAAILEHNTLPNELQQPDAPVEAMLEAARAQLLSKDEFEPYNVLARLPVKVYITANTDELLENALRSAGREPLAMLCPWREFSAETDPNIYTRNDDYDPTPEKPLVYHLFGLLSQPESLVLTEDDTFQFLIGITRHRKNIPDQVGRALTDSALLFLGFQTDEWNFRVLLHTLLAKEGNALLRRHAHIAAQIEPEEGRLLDPGRARRYLEMYFAHSSDVEINIYWGSAREFLKELAGRLSAQPAGLR